MASSAIVAATLVLTLRVQRFKWIHPGLLVVEGVTTTTAPTTADNAESLSSSSDRYRKGGKSCVVAIAAKKSKKQHCKRKPSSQFFTNDDNDETKDGDDLDRLRRAADSNQVTQLGTSASQSTETASWVDMLANERNNQRGNLVLAVECCPTTERNRKGARMIECTKFVDLRWESCAQDDGYDERCKPGNIPGSVSCHKTSTDNSQSFGLHSKILRHELFAEWIVQEYGDLALRHPILDVAGGNGELTRALLRRGVPQIILVDPKPRLSSCDTAEQARIDEKITIIDKPLVDDGSDLLEDPASGTLIQRCKILVGMHPDQGTEAIIDLSQRLNDLPFALLPCCVMPSLFPMRRQRHGDPVRSYSTFCQYLMEKGEGGMYKETSLPFDGRNKIIFHHPGNNIDEA